MSLLKLENLSDGDKEFLGNIVKSAELFDDDGIISVRIEFNNRDSGLGFYTALCHVIQQHKVSVN